MWWRLVLVIIILVLAGIAYYLWGRPSMAGAAQVMVRFPPQFEQSLVAEMNLARQKPREYIPIIRSLVDTYRTKYRQDITADAQEAISFLSSVTPCTTTLRLSKELSPVVDALIDKQGPTGNIGHEDFNERIRQAGNFRSIAENIAYGIADPREIVASWIADVNVPDRGHRKNIFSCKFTEVGVGFGPHAQFGNMAAAIYVQRFS